MLSLHLVATIDSECDNTASAGRIRVPFVQSLSESFSMGPGIKASIALIAYTLMFLMPVAASAQRITGAGATFPAPLYLQWGEAAYRAIGIELDYRAIGSAGGQEQILNRTVDFGASDAPMDASTLEQGHLLQVPTVMGAVVVIINLPGIAADELKLSETLVADIYAGTITRWNDPRIAEVNPGLKLPDLAITPIHRAEGSGTTFVWTSYLSAVSPQWRTTAGAATSIHWPAGKGARGNEGVATVVRKTTGSIGYVESVYASANNLTTIQLRNKSGHYVAPSVAAFEAAAAQADWLEAKNFAVNIINMPGEASWPIISATFILLPGDPQEPKQQANVVKFFNWAYNNGAEIAANLHYVPLPRAVRDAALAAMARPIKN